MEKIIKKITNDKWCIIMVDDNTIRIPFSLPIHAFYAFQANTFHDLLKDELVYI